MNIRNLCAFAFINLLLWCLAALCYFQTGGFFTDGYGLTFTALFIPGHILLFALGLFLLSLPARLIGPRALQTACVGWGGLFSLFFAVDILVYSQYRFHISPAMLQLFFGPAGKEIFVFPALTWVLAFAGAAVLFAAQWGLSVLCKRLRPGNKTIGAVSAAILLIFTAYNGMYAWAQFMMVPTISAQRDRLPFANPLSANRRLRKMGFEPKSEPYTMPEQGTLKYPLAPLACTPKQKMNVLIFLVESWRADSFTPEVMPNLWAWSQKKGVTYFADHLSGGNATEAGVFSLFYSMPYSYWNDFTSRHLPPVLVSEAQKLGYEPAVYSSGKLNSPEFNQNIFAGIPNLRLESKGTEKWERDIDSIRDFEAFLDTRADREQPFFGFLFLDAPHGSDYPAEYAVFTPAGEQMNYLLLSKNTDPAPYMNRYKNSMHFTDRMIDRVLKDLQKRGELDNTLIILTGDHGQEINDTRNNFWGHNSNFAKYQTHVPMFVWMPGTPGGVKNYRTNHYDVAPTVLAHAYGCVNPAGDYSIGQDLFDPAPRPFSIISSYTKKAVRTEDKLTVIDAYGNLEHYDENFTLLKAGANPARVGEAFKTFSKFYE